MAKGTLIWDAAFSLQVPRTYCRQWLYNDNSTVNCVDNVTLHCSIESKLNYVYRVIFWLLALALWICHRWQQHWLSWLFVTYTWLALKPGSHWMDMDGNWWE